MNFEKYFECDLIKLKDQHISKILNINIIKKQKTKYGDTYLIYDKENNFKYFSNTQLKSYLDKVCDESTTLINTDDYFIKDNKLSDILQIEIDSMVNKDDCMPKTSNLMENIPSNNVIVKLKILKTPIKKEKPIKKVKAVKNDIDNIDK